MVRACQKSVWLFFPLLLGFPFLAFGDVMITLSSDISLGTWSGTGGVSGTSSVCVYRSDSSSYSITLTSSSGDFELQKVGDTIPYTPSFSDSGVTGTYVTLSYGTVQGFSGANTSSSSCSGTFNAGFRIEISEANLSAATPGSYSATLTLMLTPG